VHVVALELVDFRSYEHVAVTLTPGATTFLGRNGQGKTNLVEALGYLATLGSHRVSSDTPLVRLGADHAVVRAAVVRDGRQLLLEIEIKPGSSNRARINRSPLPRSRELLGVLRLVTFAPEDLALVRGDPDQRRRFLDELVVLRTPRMAGVRADYDRVLRQRNTLLRTAAAARGGRDLSTLEVWDEHLAAVGAEVLEARLALVRALAPHVAEAYDQLAPAGARAGLGYRSSLNDDLDLLSEEHDREQLSRLLAEGLSRVRPKEVERGVSLVGPHRDDLVLELGPLPAKGYASHGESWSFALALKLASFRLLRTDGDDPVLVLDDVFAELDDGRRERLAALVTEAEQVLITAAVPGDVPPRLVGDRFEVSEGEVTHG
jgi:DNA replication and repair protein RecF